MILEGFLYSPEAYRVLASISPPARRVCGDSAVVSPLARSVCGESALVSAPARSVCGDLGLERGCRPLGLLTLRPPARGSVHKRILSASHRNVLRMALNHPSQVGYASLSYLFPHPELRSRLRP